MKRKPDSIISLFFLFCLGLAVTGFVSIESDQSAHHPKVAATQLGVTEMTE